MRQERTFIIVTAAAGLLSEQITIARFVSIIISHLIKLSHIFKLVTFLDGSHLRDKFMLQLSQISWEGIFCAVNSRLLQSFVQTQNKLSASFQLLRSSVLPVCFLAQSTCAYKLLCRSNDGVGKTYSLCKVDAVVLLIIFGSAFRFVQHGHMRHPILVDGAVRGQMKIQDTGSIGQYTREI